ncbi:hypothetical protein ACFQZ4_05345 [Catellatospora coxensis]
MALHPRPGDAPAGGDEADDVGALEIGDVGQGADPGAQAGLQQRAAGGDAHQPGLGFLDHLSVEVPAEAGAEVAGGDALGDQRGGESGEQLLQDLLPAGQQRVDVVTLRHGVPRVRAVGEQVAVDDGDGVVGVGEHAGRQGAGDAAAEHHRVAAPKAIHVHDSLGRCAKVAYGESCY